MNAELLARAVAGDSVASQKLFEAMTTGLVDTRTPDDVAKGVRV